MEQLAGEKAERLLNETFFEKLFGGTLMEISSIQFFSVFKNTNFDYREDRFVLIARSIEGKIFENNKELEFSQQSRLEKH